MKLNAVRGKSAAITTGAALLGAVAAHALTTQASEMITDKMPDSSIGDHVPAIVAIVCLGLQALDVVPKDNTYINSALLGGAVVSGMSAVRQYTGANDDTKNSEGLAKLVNQYVPGLSGLGSLPVYNYTEQAHMLATVGAPQRQLQAASMNWGSGSAIAAPQPQQVPLKRVG